MNDVSTENENASSFMNATNKRKRVHDVSFEIMALSFRPYFEVENRTID